MKEKGHMSLIKYNKPDGKKLSCRVYGKGYPVEKQEQRENPKKETEQRNMNKEYRSNRSIESRD